MIATNYTRLPAIPPEQQLDPYVSEATAADILRYDRSTLKRWRKRGIIRHAVLPNGHIRYERSYLLALLRSGGPRP
jgi:hypothetical protein